MEGGLNMGKQLEVGHSYIVKNYTTPHKVECMEVTKTCYRLKHESGNCSWIEKSEFDFGYRILEDLGTVNPIK